VTLTKDQRTKNIFNKILLNRKESILQKILVFIIRRMSNCWKFCNSSLWW